MLNKLWQQFGIGHGQILKVGLCPAKGIKFKDQSNWPKSSVVEIFPGFIFRTLFAPGLLLPTTRLLSHIFGIL